MGYYYSSNGLIAWSTAYTIVTIVILAITLPCFIAWCRIFQKVGHPWERMFVPIYNIYTQYSIANCTALFWISVCTPLLWIIVTMIVKASIVQIIFPMCVLVLHAIFCKKLATSFGKKTGWAIGLFFLYPFFIMGLGFGSAEYQKNISIEKNDSDSAT